MPTQITSISNNIIVGRRRRPKMMSTDSDFTEQKLCRPLERNEWETTGQVHINSYLHISNEI